MSCVSSTSLVDVVRDGQMCLVAVKDLVPGDEVPDPSCMGKVHLVSRVVRTYNAGGDCGQYMGLCAGVGQWVHVLGHGFHPLVRFPSSTTATTDWRAIEFQGKTTTPILVRIDGVVCAVPMREREEKRETEDAKETYQGVRVRLGPYTTTVRDGRLAMREVKCVQSRPFDRG